MTGARVVAAARRFIDRHHLAVASVAVVGLVAVAWRRRFVQDDAFISFRYAEHFAHGLGLVFNVGERVEGYTNFLYTLLIGIGMRAGLDPVALAYGIGLAAFAVSLLAAYRLARGLCRSRAAGLLAMFLLGLNTSFSAYATGGLETSLQTCLVSLFLALGTEALERGALSFRRALALSLLAALAILTRMDSVLLVAPLGALLVGGGGGPAEGRARRRAALLVPAAVLLGSWLLWKLSYYGDLLPNTFYVKAGAPSPLTLARGAWYLYRFVSAYWLEAVVAIALFRFRRVFEPSRPVPRALAVALLLWCAYVVMVGGDFMEFRLLVPVLPIFLAFVARTIQDLERLARLGTALTALVILGNIHHAVSTWRVVHGDGIESVGQLASHLDARGENWVGVGRTLGRVFDRDTGVVIATSAAGAIPFYSGLPTIDMLGLNDRWIARHGDPLGSRPGHRLVASIEYLKSRHVHLLLGHPRLLRGDLGEPYVLEKNELGFLGLAPPAAALPEDARAIEIPIGAGPEAPRLIAITLTPSPKVQDVIRREGWKIHRVEVRRRP